jgi:hypothetical protein
MPAISAIDLVCVVVGLCVQVVARFCGDILVEVCACAQTYTRHNYRIASAHGSLAAAFASGRSVGPISISDGWMGLLSLGFSFAFCWSGERGEGEK